MEENKELRKETESITEELIKDKSTNKKKKSPKALIVLGCIFLGFVLFIVFVICMYKKEYPGARTDFASIEEFGEAWGYVTEELPEGATDVRYYINRSPFEHKSIYSFVLADEEDFDAFMESKKIEQVLQRYEGEKKPYWEDFGRSIMFDASYTDEELKEMAYVEEHFQEMDYKEMLSMCDHQFGFYWGYGAKVSDYIDLREPGYEMDSYYKIPMKECFDYVIDEDLGDYIILRYDPSTPAISERTGCFVNMETRRVVVFRYSCW